MKFLIGKKIEMTQKFLDDGQVVPVTRIQAGPCFVVRKKEAEKDGYSAVMIGCEEVKELNKPLAGFFKKIFKDKIKGYRKLKEFRLEKDDPMYDKLAVGQKLSVDIFEPGDIVKVQGKSKGKGFQGVVKRHGFKGGKASHGHKDQLRMPGSIGATGPAHVFKGKKMGGRMGGKFATSLNLEVAEVRPAENEIWLKGAVPGARNGLLFIHGKGEFEVKIALRPSSGQTKPAKKSEDKKLATE